MNTLRLPSIASINASLDAGSTDITAERHLSRMSVRGSKSLTGGCGLGLLPLLDVLGHLLAEDSLVDDPHVHRIMLQKGGCGDDGGVGLHLDERLGQVVELEVSLLDG